MESKKILVLDDEEMFRGPATIFLRSLGFEVVQGTNGVEGLSLLKSGAFIGVFSDIEMPNMNGFEFLTRVRRDQSFSQIPIVMCTTLSKPEHLQKAKQLGANGYIVKPMTRENLIASLKHVGLLS